MLLAPSKKVLSASAVAIPGRGVPRLKATDATAVPTGASDSAPSTPFFTNASTAATPASTTSTPAPAFTRRAISGGVSYPKVTVCPEAFSKRRSELIERTSHWTDRYNR